MAKIIIGIHGLGNKPQASLLEEWWVTSIKEGFAKHNIPETEIPFKMVYWADILHPRPEDLSIKDVEDELFIAEPYLPSNNQASPLKEESYTSKILKYIEGQLDKIFLREDMTLNFSKVSDHFIHKYFKDLDAYFSTDCMTHDDPKCLARPAINARLYNVLKQHAKDEIMLIGHSMGSIIAYEVLLNFIDELQVDTFVTVGSPLGLPVIISRIFAEHRSGLHQKTLTAPDNILGKWYNLSDTEDLIALDHTLNDDFQPNRHGIRAQDINVYNDYTANQNRNPHKIYGYLRTKEMVSVIEEFLRKEKENIFVGQLKNFKAGLIGLFKNKR